MALSILTEKVVGVFGVNLKTLSPRKEKRSLNSEVINRSCSPNPNETLSSWRNVDKSMKPRISVL
jgi:hypothetical protein